MPLTDVHPDADALAWAAAARLTAAATDAVRQRGRFTIALSGGSTPLKLFRVLALGEWAVRLPWPYTHVFWADERCVPPDHEDSNFGAARRALLTRVPLPEEQIHRWHGEHPKPTAEAARYAEVLHEHVETLVDGNPRFDLVLLGMGADGHTASLFPHSPALGISTQPTAANYIDRLASHRLTLTYPAINAARQILFLVAGSDKAETLRRVLEGPPDPEELPSRAVVPVDGTLIWLIDEAAAAELNRS
ncbi:MAG: 6-phosphogluconolactonase [Chloroflexi bacterium]|nr:6-phosphogluconolactonase [Chloroflexota bacterium]